MCTDRAAPKKLPIPLDKLPWFFSSVSGDENVRRRSLPNRRMDRGDENYEISKSEKRERKRKRLLQALANIKQVEQR